MLSCLASVPILLLGAKLNIAGETAKVVFNAYGANAVPMEMVAQNGQLNLSGVLVANDMVTMNGASFNAMSLGDVCQPVFDGCGAAGADRQPFYDG